MAVWWAEHGAREAPRQAALAPAGRGRPTRIVCIGGGTGLPSVLRGLVGAAAELRGPGLAITALVAASDDGGSSGRLRREIDVPPPGDVRNCLVALAAPGSPLAKAFQYRFESGRGLGGHALGNLVLAALAKSEGDFLEAVRLGGELLRARGVVLPATLRPVSLVAALEDGRVVRGERNLRRARARIRAVSLEPSAPPPAPGVLEAIGAADVVVYSPGSLFSSVVTNLLVDGVAAALRASRALKVFVGNLMTQPGETDGLDGLGHLAALADHGGRIVDCAVVNARAPDPEALARYAARGAQPVHYDRASLLSAGVVPIERDVLKIGGKRIRHDSRKLAGVLLELAQACRLDEAGLGA